MARYNFDKNGKLTSFSKSSRELVKEKAAIVTAAVVLVIAAPIVIPLVLISTALYELLQPHPHVLFVSIAIMIANISIIALFGVFVWYLPKIASITLGALIYGSFAFVLLLHVVRSDIIWSSFGACLFGAVGGYLFSAFHASLRANEQSIQQPRVQRSNA